MGRLSNCCDRVRCVEVENELCAVRQERDAVVARCKIYKELLHDLIHSGVNETGKV